MVGYGNQACGSPIRSSKTAVDLPDGSLCKAVNMPCSQMQHQKTIIPEFLAAPAWWQADHTCLRHPLPTRYWQNITYELLETLVKFDFRIRAHMHAPPVYLASLPLAMCLVSGICLPVQNHRQSNPSDCHLAWHLRLPPLRIAATHHLPHLLLQHAVSESPFHHQVLYCTSSPQGGRVFLSRHYHMLILGGCPSAALTVFEKPLGVGGVTSTDHDRASLADLWKETG